MKTLSIFSLVLTLIGCSQKQENHSEAKIRFSSSFAVTGMSGGVMLYMMNLSKATQRSIAVQDDSVSISLPNGKWNFVAVGWDGANPFSGNLKCAQSVADLNGNALSIDLSLSIENCDHDFFSQSQFRNAGVTQGLRLVNCIDITGKTSGSNCDSSQRGYAGSYKIRLLTHPDFLMADLSKLNFEQSIGLSSSCITAISAPDSISTLNYKLPLGSDQFFPNAVIDLYSDASCSLDKKSFYFPQGLGQAESTLNNAITFANGNNADIYIEYGKILLNGALIFNQTITGNYDDQVYTLTNNSSSTITLIPPTLVSPFAYSTGSYPGGGTCASTLAPLGSCTISVRFSPAVGTSSNLNLNFPYLENGINKSVLLNATALGVTPANLVITAAGNPSHNFGNVNTGQVTTVQFNVFNNGQTQATAMSFAITGAGSASYSMVNNCAATLNPGSSCTIDVSFAPTVYGIKNADLDRSYHDGISVMTGANSVSGTGIAHTNVNPFFPSNGDIWNSWINQTNPDIFANSDTACNSGSSANCFHAGELRVATLPAEFSSCANLTASDSLGAFNWICHDNAGTISFRSTGLKKGKGLKNLVSATSWNAITLSVFDNGFLAYNSNPTAWWSNTIYNIDALNGLHYNHNTNPSISGTSALNSSGSVGTPIIAFDLSFTNSIYTIASNVTTSSIHIGAANVSLVTLPGASLNTNNSSSPTCNSSTGGVSSSDTATLVCAGGIGGSQFPWIEVKTGGSSEYGIFMVAPKFGRIHHSEISLHQNGFKVAGAAKPSWVTNSISRNNSMHGGIVYLSNNIQILDSEFHNNSSVGLSFSNAGTSKIKMSYAHHNGLEGFSFYNGSGYNGNIMEDSLSMYNGTSGIKLQGPTLSPHKISFSTFSHNSDHGIHLFDSSNNIIHDSIISANNSTTSEGGLVFENSSIDNIAFNLVIFGNYGPPIYFKATAPTNQKNTIINSTLVNNGFGIYSYNSSYNTFVNTITSNNGSYGLYMNSSSNNKFVNLVSTNNMSSGSGIIFQSADNNVFSNAFLVGNNNSSDCNFLSGTGNTFTDSSCTSGITKSNKDLANSFRGLASTDSLNLNAPSLVSSTIVSTTITDFTAFENNFRFWGSKDGGNSFPFTLSNAGKCDTNNFNYCGIWDWSLSSADTNILNRSGDGQNVNVAFVPGSPCPALLHGNSTTTDFQTTAKTFLTHASEILYDGFGNDNGLCETNEHCIYAPNFGAYQGHGTLTAACTFTNGTVTGVTIKAYNNNGY